MLFAILLLLSPSAEGRRHRNKNKGFKDHDMDRNETASAQESCEDTEGDSPRGFTATIFRGTRLSVRSLNHPDTYPPGHRETWRFNVAPNVLFRLTCPTFHVPRTDNRIDFIIFDSAFNSLGRARFDSGPVAESRSFVRSTTLPETQTIFLLASVTL